MKLSKKKILILFMVIFNLISIPEYSLGADEYEVDNVASFFSPDLLQGQNYTWVLQEWYQMEDWLRQGTSYEPKSGDVWTMSIIGDLSKVILTFTKLEFFGIHYEPLNLPKLSDYLQFNISGYSFDEVFGDPELEEHNWLMLSRLFLIPYTIEDLDGNTQNASSFILANLENIVAEAEVDTGRGDLYLEGSVTGQYYETHIDLESSIGLLENFTYTMEPVTAGLNSGRIEVNISKKEFKYSDTDDSNTVDFPYDISSYPYLLGWSIVAVIILVKVKKKSLNDLLR